MKKKRLLLVEDDEAMCEELVPILEDNGYLIDVAHEGKTAISFLEKTGYELLLLDLKLPGISGYEVLKYVKKVLPAIKIIVLSGSPLRPGAMRTEEQVFPSGGNYEGLVSQLADGFINKPFDVEEVLSQIKAQISR